MDTSKVKFNKTEAENKPTLDFTKKTWKDDVTFLVEDKRIYASKSVLANVSPVFEAMFSHNFKENLENEGDFHGKKADEVLEFLHCIYPNSSKTVSEDNVQKVLPLAHEYQTFSLLEKCKQILNTYIRNQNGTLSCQELLQYYNTAVLYGMPELQTLSLDEIINEDDFDDVFFEAERIMDKDSLLKFKRNIIVRQAKRMDDVTTRFVKYALTTSKGSRYINGFENAKGAIIEHTIENVFDPSLQDEEYSKPVKIWNASFTIHVSVFQTTKKVYEQSEKYLSAYLRCSLPGDKWSFEVKGEIVLEHVFAVKNQILTRADISHTYKSPDALSFGEDTFGKLSEFLKGTKSVANYTGKVVAYILAKKPVEEEGDDDDDDDDDDDEEEEN